MNSPPVELFVMPGCAICPQMEHIFTKMLENGEISSLEIHDISGNESLVQQFNIRSVPFYLINGVAFNGARSRLEVLDLLQQDQIRQWATAIEQALSAGDLASAEQAVEQHTAAREAMLELLADSSTELVVRIGLTAIIEGFADRSWMKELDGEFAKFVNHQDQRIAIDALYYLSLLNTADSERMLVAISEGTDELAEQARDLLLGDTSERIVH